MAIDNNDPDQYAVRDVKISADNSVPMMLIGNEHWQVPAVDDVIKYMSSVPDYLHRLEKGHGAEEKALNIGVLDWRHLENWRNKQKEVTKRSVDSPYGTNSSSSASSSTFGSSSQCDRSTDSDIAQSKQTPAFKARQNSFVGCRRSISYTNEKDHGHVMSNSDPKASCNRPTEKDKKVKSQIGRLKEKFLRRKQPSNLGDMHFSADWLEEQGTVAEKGMLDRVQRRAHVRSISCDLAALNNRRHVEVTRQSISGDCLPLGSQLTRRREISPGRHAGLKRSLSVKPMKQSNVSENFHEDNGNSRDRNRRNISAQRLLSSGLNLIRNSSWREGSSGKVMKQTTRSCNLHEDIASSGTISMHVEKNNGRKSISGDIGSLLARGREISPGCHAGLERSLSVKPMKQSNVLENFHEDNGNSRDKNRHSRSAHRLLSSGMNLIRNSSWREGSSGKVIKQTTHSCNSHEENASSGTKSRLLAPLLKILNPLLKLKKNKPHLSRDKVNTGDGVKSVQSMHANFSSLPNHVTEAGNSVQSKRPVIPTRQALLKLIWKNELPLFMFSVDDNMVLSASIGQGSLSQENDLSCTYTIFTVHEAKKKGGVWIGQGNKSQKRDVSYGLIGQMRVSFSEGTSSRFVMREFVLFGGELAQKTSENSNFSFNSELAAIVIQVPNEHTENTDAQGYNSKDSSHRSSEKNIRCAGNMHIDERNSRSCVASVIAVLPNRIHSTSSTGEPYPLIERWRSGGACDCGGWDEGCMLTVLTDEIQEGTNPSSSEALSAHATNRIELFPQGDGRGNKHTFRLTAFEDDVYKVEFGESIALVQAFAMSVAILHSKKPHALSGMYYSMRAKSIRENIAANHTSIASEATY